MTHAICSTTNGNEFDYLRGLWGHLFAPELDLETKLERLFAAETAEFDLEYAFFARIDQRARTEVFEVVHPSGRFEMGDVVPLPETYCRRTIADPDGTLVVDEASAEGWVGDPAYERYGLESYVGTTVTLDGDLYGTLCFASSTARSEPLDEREVALVEMLGEWVTYELNRRESTDAADGEQEPLPPTRIDAVMTALGARERRAVLLNFLDGTTEYGLDALDRVAGADDLRLRLHHTHLPKLAGAGYVDWDRDADVVRRGPEFPEVEPLLRMLAPYSQLP